MEVVIIVVVVVVVVEVVVVVVVVVEVEVVVVASVVVIVVVYRGIFFKLVVGNSKYFQKVLQLPIFNKYSASYYHFFLLNYQFGDKYF